MYHHHLYQSTLCTTSISIDLHVKRWPEVLRCQSRRSMCTVAACSLARGLGLLAFYASSSRCSLSSTTRRPRSQMTIVCNAEIMPRSLILNKAKHCFTGAVSELEFAFPFHHHGQPSLIHDSSYKTKTDRRTSWCARYVYILASAPID